MTRPEWVRAASKRTGKESTIYEANLAVDLLLGRPLGRETQKARVTKVRKNRAATYSPISSTQPPPKRGQPAKETSLEEDIRAAYARFGDLQAAAKHLGMAKRTFAKRCEQFGVPTRESA